MTAREIEQIVLEIAPPSGGIPGDPTGILYGDPEQEIAGIASTWTTTVKVLQQAATAHLNFVLSHEIPFFTGVESRWFATLPEDQRPHNIARRRILDEQKLVICRCHSNWDAVPAHGVADSCARALAFGAPIHQSHFIRMYSVPAQTLAQLADWTKVRLGLPQVRVAGDLGRMVEKVGIAYGGLAQSFGYIDEFIMNGADAVIVGEAIDYSVRAAIDAGVGFIETSHVGSENPGMRNFARLLQEQLPELPVKFIDAGHDWSFR